MSTTLVRRVLAPGACILLLLALLDGTSYLGLGEMNTLVTMFGLVAIAQSWNIIAGLTGQASLGVSAFVGTGGYATVLLLIHSGVSVIEAMLIATAIGAALAAIVSPAVFRLRGPYFTVGTLGLALAIQAFMETWSFSGGTQALLMPFTADPSQNAIYRMAVVIAVVAMLTAWLIRRSNFGLRMMAVRDNELAAATLGVPTFRIKCAAFIISGAIMALAGSLIAVQNASVEPTASFGLGFTISAVVMTIVGGAGTLIGPVIGVLIVFYGIQQQLQSSAELSQLLTGVLLILVIRFAPVGAWPLLRETTVRIVHRLKTKLGHGASEVRIETRETSA